MKILIIDSSRAWMADVRRALARVLPDIEVSEYDADQQGMPAETFCWDLYDALLLSQELGDQPAGLNWLIHYRAQAGFPPTILVAANDDVYLAAQAIKAGAQDYLRRADIFGERLPAILQGLAIEAEQRTQAIAAQSSGFQRGGLGAQRRTRPPIDDTAHRFVRLIGQGGFSRVYLAERAEDGSPVVLKIVDRNMGLDSGMLRRFAREAQILASIEDPYVVKVFDRGITDDYGYIAMEFFAGGDLKQRVERGMTVPAAIDCMWAIARGLHAIHREGVIHRDLKPANIMFRADGSLALADFGISRRIHERIDLTTATGTLGTPGYISPEQALGTPVDHRADLYSAGVIFYELLTGRKPFRAETPAGIVYQHIHTAPPPLPARLASAQPVIDLLLAKDPADRLSSAAELMGCLDEWLPSIPWPVAPSAASAGASRWH